MKAYLFLDVDGVLHDNALHFAVEDVRSSPAALHRAGLFVHATDLAQLLAPFDVEVVVHSSWRRTHALGELRALMGLLGTRVRGATTSRLDREEGILDYMMRHRISKRQVVIVDDQPGGFTELRHRVIVTDPRDGVGASGTRSQLIAALERIATLKNCR